MKPRHFIGGLIAIIGMTAVVAVCDGSAYETLIRVLGITAILGGALVAKVFKFQNRKKVKA